MQTLGILVLVCTAWAGVQETNRYYDKLGGFYDYNGFVIRLNISQEAEQKVDEKMVWKTVDILNIVDNFVQWTSSNKDVFRKEKCMILNFGYGKLSKLISQNFWEIFSFFDFKNLCYHFCMIMTFLNCI